MAKNILNIQKNILDWYYENGRKLPWRETTNPYYIHISEVMLQQTQVDRVIPYFHRRIKSFPNYKTLANASKLDLLTHWSWLWFNSRALRLQECAKIITDTYNWKLEQDREFLMKLPGIWPYTSAAIMSFAWNQEVPVIDTNIRRVLIFLFKLEESILLKELENFAISIIPSNKSRDWHNALMDYGSSILTAKKTKIKSLWKQSKFEGSDRQVRGWIIKQITKKKELTIKIIQDEFPNKNIITILDSMKKEKTILVVWDKILLE